MQNVARCFLRTWSIHEGGCIAGYLGSRGDLSRDPSSRGGTCRNASRPRAAVGVTLSRTVQLARQLSLVW